MEPDAAAWGCDDEQMGLLVKILTTVRTTSKIKHRADDAGLEKCQGEHLERGIW